MADQQHLSLLKKSVEEFNQSRTENPTQQPDLSRANLTRVNLTRADLTRADLTRADLTRADLTRADLTRANLTRANLTGANLRSANLTGAQMIGADLTGADLSGARMSRLIKSQSRGKPRQRMSRSERATGRIGSTDRARKRGLGAGRARKQESGSRRSLRLAAPAELNKKTGATTKQAASERTILRVKLSGAHWDPDYPPTWPEGYEPPDNARQTQEAARKTQEVQRLTSPVLRVSMDVGPAVAPSELTKQVARLSDVAAVIAALMPAFAGADAETVKPEGGGAASGAESTPSFVVQAMRYENPLVMDLAFGLIAGGSFGAILRYQEQLRETIDWIRKWKENRPAEKEEARSRVQVAITTGAKARADEAQAALTEERARIDLAKLRQSSGTSLDSLPPRADRTLRDIVDHNIELKALESAETP